MELEQQKPTERIVIKDQFPSTEAAITFLYETYDKFLKYYKRNSKAQLLYTEETYEKGKFKKVNRIIISRYDPTDEGEAEDAQLLKNVENLVIKEVRK